MYGLLESLEPRRLLAGADLDPAFGDGGVRTESIPNEIPLVQSLTVQPDGNVIVKGLLNGASTQHALRYLPDGSIDPSFVLDPLLTDVGFTTALRNGKIIAVVNTQPPANTVGGSHQIARLNSDGSLDTTFGGGDGIVDLPVNGGLFIADLDVAIDGRIAILGREEPVGSTALKNTLIVLSADGTPLNSFGGGDGIVQTLMRPDINTEESWDEVAFAPDGKIAVGRVHADFINGDESKGTQFLGFLRFNIDGTLDPAFTDGAKLSWTRVETGGFFGDLDVASNGSIIAVGSARLAETGGALLIKSTPTGAADLAVGPDGSRIINFGLGEFTSLADVQTIGDGRFYAVGEVARLNKTTLVVARFNADSSLDTTFGGNDEGGGVLRISEPRMGKPYLGIAPDGGVFVANDCQVSQTDSTRIWHTRRLLGDPTIRVNSKGSLLIDGTTDADDVSITRRARDGRIVARINGYARSFSPAKVKRIAIFAHGGNDLASIGLGVLGSYGEGGDGNDTLVGGDDGDVFLGGVGNDQLLGNAGDDILLGGGGRDYLLGGAGKDDLFGNAGIDTLSGAGGNDRLFGGPSGDYLYGGAGHDARDADESDVVDAVESVLV